MRHGIVEGEPGIFPDPIARLFRAIGRVFGAGKEPDRAAPPTDAPPPDAPPSPGPGGEQAPPTAD